MKQKLAFLKNRMSRYTIAAGALVVSGFASATTTETSAAVTAMSSMQDQASSMIDAAWPFATLVVGAAIGLKLFKKFANKAS